MTYGTQNMQLPLHMRDLQQINSPKLSKTSSSGYDPTKTNMEVYFLGINLEEYSLVTSVSLFTIGIFITYITVFIIQESVFKESEFVFAGLLAFFQFSSYAMCGSIHRIFVPQPNRRTPMSFLFKMGFYSVAGTAASTYSLNFLSFPTWVLFKSSRVIGVMIGGIFILGKRYHFKEYLGVFLLAVGLVVFTLGDISLKADFHPVGILLVIFSLVMNSVEGNMQEKGLSHYKASENEMVVWVYGFGALQILPFLLWNGELVDGFMFCKDNLYVLAQIVAHSLLGYFGIMFVLGLVRISSALTTVIVTSCRKALTVIFSFLLFTKPLSVYHVLGFLVFFSGVALNVYHKNSAQIKQVIEQLFLQKRKVKHELDDCIRNVASTVIKNV
jgi:adenosine 3'-phospho 5'-phosphosulfate transporter B3